MSRLYVIRNYLIYHRCGHSEVYGLRAETPEDLAFMVTNLRTRVCIECISENAGADDSAEEDV